jgi:hypothetical protein
LSPRSSSAMRRPPSPTRSAPRALAVTAAACMDAPAGG